MWMESTMHQLIVISISHSTVVRAGLSELRLL
ncbi:hypothetical protein ANCCAN_29574 [Ancylostoma caninum]|uniref:Uncharacterized protein n=1 Tax=Ancylostoma caninum TaxID=29170 RepID=A0A368EY42_ANCCA|nr:hypothetical protein ANCCAN_29574 [Ancylostoma caninum]